MVLFMNVNNLTNRANYSGFSGTKTSPFFMKPRSVNQPPPHRLRHEREFLRQIALHHRGAGLSVDLGGRFAANAERENRLNTKS
jgi:hypothetical protein